jgi:hypothetical protein
MSEFEQLKLRLEYLEDDNERLRLRLQNAQIFIEYCLNGKKEKKDGTLEK